MTLVFFLFFQTFLLVPPRVPRTAVVIDYGHIFAESNIVVGRTQSHKTPHHVLLRPCLLKILNLNFIDLINRHYKGRHPIIQVL